MKLNEISKKLVNRYLKKTDYHQISAFSDDERKKAGKRENMRNIAKLKLDPSKRSHPLKDKKIKANVLATNESIVTLVSQNNLIEAEKLFKEQMYIAVKKKLLEHKKMLMAKLIEAKDGSDGTWTDESKGSENKYKSKSPTKKADEDGSDGTWKDESKTPDKKKSWIQKFKDKKLEDK